MIPTLSGIDHVHIYVANWDDAEAWYAKTLGLKRVESLLPWAVEGGPLTIENPAGTVHLALFESTTHPPTTAIAFGVSAEGFLQWKNHLESEGIEVRVKDHTLAYSLYFRDPWGNYHEITTYDRDQVAAQLES